jgi:hypothetical protein
LNFEDEHYVRIYTRDTKTWLRWGWEGQTVFCLLDRKLDKAGVLDDVDDPTEDVALVTGLPIEVVAVGLPRLLASGTIEHRGTKLVCPNYIPANTAKKSDRLRTQDSRERRAAVARHGESQGVTGENENPKERDEVSRNSEPLSRFVTESHGESQGVTSVSHKADQHKADQINADQINADQINTPTPRGKIPCPPDLSLTPDQVATLEAGGLMIPKWAIDELTATIRVGWLGDDDPSKHKTLAHWRSYLLGAIRKSWQDPKRRPRKPDPNPVPRVTAEELEARERADEEHRQALLAKYGNLPAPEAIDYGNILEGVG